MKGVFFISQQAAKMMKEDSAAEPSSLWPRVNAIRPAAFSWVFTSITKAGIVAMTKSFAKELASLNIRVNALLPGLTDTIFVHDDHNPDMMKMILPMIPLGRAAKPEEMAGAVLYLVPMPPPM